MRHRRKIAGTGAPTVAWTLVLLLASCLSASSARAAEGLCPNEAHRGEQSAVYLPNCRAYEQVTPVQKDADEPRAVVVGSHERSEFEPIEGGVRAAVNGERIAWSSEYSLPGLAGATAPAEYLLSTRTAGGWTTEATPPPQSPENGVLCAQFEGIVGWSPNLTSGVLADGRGQEGQLTKSFLNEGLSCGHAEPALREADGSAISEPAGFQSLFLRDGRTGAYQLVNVTPSTAPTPTPSATPIPARSHHGLGYQEYFRPEFLAASPHLKHVVFEDELPLTAEAEHLTRGGAPLSELEAACKEVPKGRACWEGHDDLYVWNEGVQPAVRLVSILPDGKPAEGVLAAGAYKEKQDRGVERPWQIAGYRHAASARGSRIFFESEGNLYARVNAGQAQSAIAPGSTAVNGSQCTEPAKACTIQLDAAQGGSNSGGGSWLVASEDGARVFFTDEHDLTGNATATAGEPDLYEYDFEAPLGARLTDLTVGSAEHADVLGVLGASADGSYVYFAAQGDLTGSQQSSRGAKALAAAAGSGDLVGPAEARGVLTEGSPSVVLSSVTDEFHVGQRVEGFGIAAGTTVIGCSPDCSTAKAVMTLSAPAVQNRPFGVLLKGPGETTVSDVTASKGTFATGTAITGAGIPAHTWITAVGTETLTLSQPAAVSATGVALSATPVNVYLRHGGATTFIASLNAEANPSLENGGGGDVCDWACASLTSRVSGNGLYLAFNSVDALTGYRNTGSQCGYTRDSGGTFEGYRPGSCQEIYLYEAQANSLACVSCNPNGAPVAQGAAINKAASPIFATGMRAYHPQRNVSETGQVFFETAEPLLPAQDINAQRDVYEYEHGALHMISSGTSSAPSYFLEATPSGSDVFFATAQKLLTQDTDSAYDVYDARVGGGFAQPPAPVEPCKSSTGCKGSATVAPSLVAPGSATFAGPGNLTRLTPPATRNASKPGKNAARNGSKARLRGALRRCARGFRRSARKRRLCARRARGRLGRRAGTSRRRARRGARSHRRARARRTTRSRRGSGR
ncbi:MAG: hypothetical protein ACYCYN_03725 [Solirubrobacteraceae bacterium]